jgi:hypothetical protein
MPLLDHFRPPLSVRRHWHAFHNAWATYIASDLNRILPDDYFAEPNVKFGIEIDVATFDEAGASSPHGSSVDIGWTAPAPTQTIPISIITDLIEVLVFSREAGPTLAGAIELVSPANKDRAAHREAFVSKCAAYLQQGVGLLIVDVVTDRLANLHDELVLRLGTPEAATWGADLYACSYRPVMHDGEASLDLWRQALTIGESLPTLPLWLPGGLCLPVDLDAACLRTCREHRISGNGS